MILIKSFDPCFISLRVCDLIQLIQMGTNSSKIAVSTPRDNDTPIQLSSNELQIKQQSRFEVLDLKLKEISQMKYRVRENSELRTLLSNESGEHLDSHRASQTQIKLFYNVFRQDQENYIDVDPEGYLTIRNTQKPREHGIVFRGLKMGKLPDDFKDALGLLMRTQKAMMSTKYGGLLPDEEEEEKGSPQQPRMPAQHLHIRNLQRPEQPEMHHYGETQNLLNGSTPDQSINAGSLPNSRRRADSPPINGIPLGDYGCTGETAQAWGRQSSVNDANNIDPQSTIQDANNSSIVNYEINRSSINDYNHSRTQSLNAQQNFQNISLTHQNTQQTPRVNNDQAIHQQNNDPASMPASDQIQSITNTLIPINRTSTENNLKIDENSNKIKIQQKSNLTIPVTYKSPSYKKKTSGKDSTITDKNEIGDQTLSISQQMIQRQDIPSSQSSISTVNNQINSNIKLLRQRPPNLQLQEHSQNSNSPVRSEISTSIQQQQPQTALKRNDHLVIQSEQHAGSDPSQAELDSAILINSQNMSSIAKIGRNLSDSKQNESMHHADRVLTQMTNKKGGILSSCTMDTPDFINTESNCVSPQKDQLSSQVSPERLEMAYSSIKKRGSQTNFLNQNASEGSDVKQIIEKDVNQKSTEQGNPEVMERFRIAIFGDNVNMESHDKYTAEMVKQWMTNNINAKHQKIIENPKEEKKDGLSEYLDQKRKLARYKGAFRSAKNIDFGLHSVQNTSNPKNKRKLNRINSNDDCKIEQDHPNSSSRKKASLRSKVSPPKRVEGQEKQDLLNTQKNTFEDSLSRQQNCSEQNSPLITFQNDLIGDQGLDLEVKNCSIQNSEAKIIEDEKIQEADHEDDDLDNLEVINLNNLNVQRRRSSLKKIEKLEQQLLLKQNTSMNQDQNSSEKSQETNQTHSQVSSSFQSRPSSFHQKRQKLQSVLIQVSELDPSTIKQYQNGSGIEEQQSSSSDPGDYSMKESKETPEKDLIKTPFKQQVKPFKNKSCDFSAIDPNVAENLQANNPVVKKERKKIKHKSRSGRNLTSDNDQNQMYSSSNELQPVSNRMSNRTKRRTQYTKQTKSIEMPSKRRKAQLKSTKSEDLIITDKRSNQKQKHSSVKRPRLSRQQSKLEKKQQFKRSMSMIYRIIDTVFVPIQKRHMIQQITSQNIDKSMQLMPTRYVNIQKASSSVKIEANNSESYNSSPLQNSKDSEERASEIPYTDQIKFVPQKSRTQNLQDILPKVVAETEQQKAEQDSFEISSKQANDIQLKKIQSATVTATQQNLGQYKKLLSLNTVQEENKEYDQSSVCHSLKNNSVYHEKINQLIRADIKRQYFNAKNKFEKPQDYEIKGQKDRKRYFGRQKTQNLSESKDLSDKIIQSHGIQQRSQFMNSQTGGNQKSLDMNSVMSERQLSHSSNYKAESQKNGNLNKYNPQIFSSSIVSNNVHNQLSPLLPKNEKREKDSENSRTSSRLHDKPSSVKNNKKKTHSSQMNNEQDSQPVVGESMSINSKFSHQNLSIKQSEEGQNVQFESKLVRQNTQSDCNCKDGVFSPESQLSGHDNVQIEIKQLDKSKESRKKILKMRIQNNQIISSDQYIYSHDYKPPRLPQDRRPIDGQNLIKSVKLISKKLKIKDKQSKLPVIFTEIKRNQITRTMMNQQKLPFPIKQCEDFSSETNMETRCQHQQLTNLEIQKYYNEKANTSTAVNLRPNSILDSKQIFLYENFNQIQKNKSTNVSPNAAREAIILSDQLTSGYHDDQESFIENLMENYAYKSRTGSKISTQKSKKTTSKKSTSKSNEMNQTSQFKRKSETSSLTKEQQQSLVKPSIENSDNDYNLRLTKPQITRNISENIKQRPYNNSSLSLKSQNETVFTPKPFVVGNTGNDYNALTNNVSVVVPHQATAQLKIIHSKSEVKQDDHVQKQFADITSYENVEEESISDAQQEKDDLESSSGEDPDDFVSDEDEGGEDEQNEWALDLGSRAEESGDEKSMRTYNQYGLSIDGHGLFRLDSSISGTPSKRSKNQSTVKRNSFSRQDSKRLPKKLAQKESKEEKEKAIQQNEKDSEFEFNNSIKSNTFLSDRENAIIAIARRRQYSNKACGLKTQEFTAPIINKTAMDADKHMLPIHTTNEKKHNSGFVSKSNGLFNNQPKNFKSSSNDNETVSKEDHDQNNYKRRSKPCRGGNFKENIVSLDHTPKSAQVTKNDKIQRTTKLISSQDEKSKDAASMGQIKSYSNDKFSPSSPTIFQKIDDDSKTPNMEDNNNVEDQDFSNQVQRMQRHQDKLFDNSSPIQKSNSFINKDQQSSNCVSPMTQDGAHQAQNDEEKDLTNIKKKVNKTGFKTPGHSGLLVGFNIKRVQTQDERFSSQKTNQLDSQITNKEMDFLSPNSPSRKFKKGKYQQASEESKQNHQQNRNRSMSGCSSPSGTSQCSSINHQLTQYTISTSSCISRSKKGKKVINQYELSNEIGKGQFAQVIKIRDTNDNQQYAMKVINKQQLKKRMMGPKKSQFNMVEKEIAIMKKMGHPHIVKLIEVIDDPNHNKQFLIQEYVPGGDLQSVIQKSVDTGPLIDEKTLRMYFRQLMCAVWYCHEIVGIIHRDIKPDNILIDSNNNIKLTDFGVSDTFQQKKVHHHHHHHHLPDGTRQECSIRHDNAGSYCYYCPEACSGGGYSGEQADIWACGVTLYQMAFGGKLPFVSKSNNISELYTLIQNEDPEYKQEEIKANIENKDPLLALIQSMLQKDPKKRISMGQMQQHPWITNNGEEPCDWATEVLYHDFEKPTDDEVSDALTQIKDLQNMIFKRVSTSIHSQFKQKPKKKQQDDEAEDQKKSNSKKRLKEDKGSKDLNKSSPQEVKKSDKV